jgi:N-acylglucosamine-6-phosphate 2-epimerase
MTKQEIFDALKGNLIVSCQALPGEPLYVEEKSIMYLMARAAKQAGACAIRTNSTRDVIAIKKETGLPVIGLIKKKYEGYENYISPTMSEIDQLVGAGADIVAADFTFVKRGDGLTAGEYLKAIKEKYPDIILMADISTYEEGVNAWECGADLVGTTMSGYTAFSPHQEGPDYELVQRLSEKLPIPVIGEGRIHTPEQAVQTLDCGAHAVVVGGAITRPLEIAQRFISKISARKEKKED